MALLYNEVPSEVCRKQLDTNENYRPMSKACYAFRFCLLWRNEGNFNLTWPISASLAATEFPPRSLCMRALDTACMANSLLRIPSACSACKRVVDEHETAACGRKGMADARANLSQNEAVRLQNRTHRPQQIRTTWRQPVLGLALAALSRRGTPL